LAGGGGSGGVQDQVIDLGGIVAAGDELAHLPETAGSDPVVLCASLGQFVLNQLGQDRQDGGGSILSYSLASRSYTS
jgi:hypothetical protein